MNLICIPFAYEENMNSGVNVSIKGKGKIEIYLKNACVALISAKYYNPDSDVALVTNFGRWNIPEEFLSIFDKWEIKVMEIPFDQFRFQGSYTWALAFYKLCVLKKLSCMKYESICYMDTDVYIQGSFDAIWTECRQNIMLYDINHGLNTREDRCVEEHVRDWNSVKTRVREALSSYIYRRTKRSPMILPILMEV